MYEILVGCRGSNRRPLNRFLNILWLKFLTYCRPIGWDRLQRFWMHANERRREEWSNRLRVPCRPNTSSRMEFHNGWMRQRSWKLGSRTRRSSNVLKKHLFGRGGSLISINFAHFHITFDLFSSWNQINPVFNGYSNLAISVYAWTILKSKQFLIKKPKPPFVFFQSFE